MPRGGAEGRQLAGGRARGGRAQRGAGGRSAGVPGLVEEAGAVWADDVHELLELAKTLAVSRARRTGRGAGSRS